MKTIILASASPRRKVLLEKIGLIFEVEPSNYEEDMPLRLEPHGFAQKLSLEKAKAVASKHKNSIVIAADTLIVFGGRILGKPHTKKDAREMLEAISGKYHNVITGFSIIDTGINKTLSRSVETKVYITYDTTTNKLKIKKIIIKKAKLKKGLHGINLKDIVARAIKKSKKPKPFHAGQVTKIMKELGLNFKEFKYSDGTFYIVTTAGKKIVVSTQLEEALNKMKNGDYSALKEYAGKL